MAKGSKFLIYLTFHYTIINNQQYCHITTNVKSRSYKTTTLPTISLILRTFQSLSKVLFIFHSHYYYATDSNEPIITSKRRNLQIRTGISNKPTHLIKKLMTANIYCNRLPLVFFWHSKYLQSFHITENICTTSQTNHLFRIKLLTERQLRK